MLTGAWQLDRASAGADDVVAAGGAAAVGVGVGVAVGGLVVAHGLMLLLLMGGRRGGRVALLQQIDTLMASPFRSSVGKPNLIDQSDGETSWLVHKEEERTSLCVGVQVKWVSRRG